MGARSTRRRGGRPGRALVVVLGAFAVPLSLGVMTAAAEEVEPVVDLPEAVVEPVPEPVVEPLPAPAPEPVPVPEPAPEPEATEPEAAPTLVTITPSGDEQPIVDAPEAGPTVTVTPPTDDEPDAEVVVTAEPDGPARLEVLIAPDPATIPLPLPDAPPSTPVPPLALTVTEPAAGQDGPTAVVEHGADGTVTAVVVTPAASGPAVLELELWGGADALQQPAIELGSDAEAAHVRITLPTPVVAPSVALSAPSSGAGQPTVKLRALGPTGDVVRVTLVPLPQPDEGSEGPAPAPAPPVPTTEVPVAAPVEPAPEPTPATTVPPRTADVVATGDVAPPSAELAPPVAPVARPVAPRPQADGRLDMPTSPPQVVTTLGRRSVQAAREFPIPTGLTIAVAVFLLVQGRFDRRDPRLAAAPADDELLGFG